MFSLSAVSCVETSIEDDGHSCNVQQAGCQICAGSLTALAMAHQPPIRLQLKLSPNRWKARHSAIVKQHLRFLS